MIWNGIASKFYQDNISYSKKSVLRGLHFQKHPFEQGKLVQVLIGKIYDVAVDINKNSKNFGKWKGTELDINKQLYIPPGFAHGFQALEDSIILYKCTNYYNKDSEYTIIYDDKDLNIKWPIENVIISEKDKHGITFKNYIKT